MLVFHQPVPGNEAHQVAETRIGVRLIVGPPHAAADGDVEAFEASRPRHGDQTEILRIDVDVVRRRNDEADLELTRHVGGSVKGLLRSEEHTSELQTLMRNSYAVFCLKKK